ncbi:hypothetical protein GJ496_011225 [Pomphorhynchus laevis]|nr:hypothetical protein GJ496_011225 [Pomphorhynchus laevis]
MFRSCKCKPSLITPLDCCIDKFFLPKITCQTQIKDFQREIIALPTRFGGLGIGNPSSLCAAEWNFSVAMCSPLEAGLTGIDLDQPDENKSTHEMDAAVGESLRTEVEEDDHIYDVTLMKVWVIMIRGQM